MRKKMEEMTKKMNAMSLKRAFTIEDIKDDDNKVNFHVENL
jgi:hypothetical protein